MRKLAAYRVVGALAAVGAVGAVGTAQAEKPTLPKTPTIHPVTPKPPKVHPVTPNACLTHRVGYNASGTLVSAALTPTGRGRYTGTLTVNVTRLNHHLGSTGPATVTLTAAHVTFGPGVSSTVPVAGSRVRLHGTITRLSKRCSATTFTPTVTITHVEIKAKK